MFYVISQYAWWIILGAFGLGLIVGLSTWTHKPRGSWLSGWLTWATIAFVIGVMAAIFKLLAGRAGLWLETGLIMFAAYIIGCWLGSWLRGIFSAPAPVLTGMSARPTAAGVATATAAAYAFPMADANAPLALDTGAAYPGKRPTGLGKPDGAPDDLTRIQGIAAIDQKMLNDLGIHHARQVAVWKPENARWINHHMARPSRVEAEGWISKAAEFVRTGGVRAVASAPAAAPLATAAAATLAASVATVATVARAAPALPPAPTPAAAPVSAHSSAPAPAPVQASMQPPAASASAPTAGDLNAPHPGSRPVGLLQPRPGGADDLKRIRGISPNNEDQLNRLGVFHYDQIAGWRQDETRWADSYMGTPGRVARDEWTDQARLLAQAQRNQHMTAAAAAGQGTMAAPAAAPAANAPSAVAFASAAQPSAGNAAASSSAASAPRATDAVTAAGQATAAAGTAESGGSATVATGTAATITSAMGAAGAAALGAATAGSTAGGQTISQAAPAAGDANAAHPGSRPLGLSGARGGKPDDLQVIRGIGPQNEAKLHGLGVWHFDQIGNWSADEAKWVGSYMAFPGRIEREKWIDQAKLLARGDKEGFNRLFPSSTHTGEFATGAHPAKPGDPNAPHPGERPPGLALARSGKPDAIIDISGIGPQNVVKLNELGIWHFDQIAAWTPKQVEWLGSYLAFPGRIDREDWIGQAKRFASGAVSGGGASGANAGSQAGSPGSSSAGAGATAAAAAAAAAFVPVLPFVTSEVDAKYPGLRPPALNSPRDGEPDDLLRIKGIGKSNLDILHSLGIWHFDQIARWSKDEIKWVDNYLSFPGRIAKEDWVSQAKHFAQRRAIELAARKK